MIDVLDVLELDDNNEYVVVSKTKFDNKKFYYIVDKLNNSNYKICYEENDDLIEIENQDLIKKLLPLFLENAKDQLISLAA